MDGTTIRYLCAALALAFGLVIFIRRRRKTE
jgi:hypothetical protein